MSRNPILTAPRTANNPQMRSPIIIFPAMTA